MSSGTLAPETAATDESEDVMVVRTRGSRPAPASAAAQNLGPPQRQRRAFTLVLLTLLVPGSAQLAAGNRPLGRVAFRIWVCLLALCLLVGALFAVSRPTAIGLLSRGSVLTLLQWTLAGWALLWGLLFVDAWRLGRPAGLARRARRWLLALTAALLVVTSGGLVYAASNVGAGRDALDALFQGRTARGAAAGRFNVLLLGGDSGADRVGTRPDSIQLVSVDAQSGRTVTFGFSRDTENINFLPGSTMARLMPKGWNCGDQCLLNGLFTWADNHKKEFPPTVQNPGVEATREAVEALSGLHIQYYVLIDLQGFKGLIDALGGLDINVQERTPIGGGTSRVSGWIEPGRQHLDGYHALWYARSRQGSSNYERMARQRCVMTALVQQVDPQSLVLHFAGLAAATKGVLKTDLPQSELGRFAELAIKARSQKIRSVNFVPPLIKPWDYNPAVIRNTVQSTIRASEQGSASSAKASGASAAGQGGSSATMSSTASAGPATVRTTGSGTPSAPANADTSDLSGICSAG
jgi:LCP family protein required for cell wall assembly